MRRNLKAFLFILIFTYTLLIGKNVKAEEANYSDKTYKIGVIKLEAYADVNEKGNFEGYYIDLFDLIAKDLNLNYEYVLVSISEAINKLENGELDFCLGLTVTEQRAEKFIFNVNPIAFEKFALYTNKDIDTYNINAMDGLIFGKIKSAETNWILEFFKAANISVDIVQADNYGEINQWLENGTIDLTLDSAYKKTKYKKIYEFVSSQVYIAANKNNKELLNDIDDCIVTKGSKINNIYNSYFDKSKIIKENMARILIILLVFIFLIAIIIFLFPKFKEALYKSKLKKAVKKGKYSIYYQPIYKAEIKEITAFEVVLKNEITGSYLIHSREFINKFKESTIMSYMCFWVLKKMISDYKEIKKNNYLNKRNFYIAINIPINQIKNNKFVNKMIKLLNESELDKNSICIEVIGSIKDINKVINNIERLKESGFIIAVDDFGIEYSNLNIIQALDIDIIKIDKTFTSNMHNNLVKSEIVMFISRIGKAKNKIVVLDGIDKLEQHKKLKEIDCDKLCVQGSFYNEPMSIEDINKL